MKQKESKFEVKELLKTARGRAILFFGAYLLFFLFIGIFARTGEVSKVNQKYDSGSPLRFSIREIEKNNYKFNFEISVEDNISLYQGEIADGNSLFTNDELSYYYNGQKYFTNKNDIWVAVDNPYIYYEFIDVNNINKLIENSTYISKTEYESGKVIYNFDISTSTIIRLLENKEIDVDDVTNSVILSVNEDNVVDEVKYNLNSYCQFKNICDGKMDMVLKYGNFGLIEKINNPLEDE